MRELRGDLDLAQEPVRAEERRELGVQDLEGDRAVVLEVLGETDGGHAAAAQLALDLVPAGKGSPEAIQQVGHDSPDLAPAASTIRPHAPPGEPSPSCAEAARRRP
jgi:hypothetical protein